jgi:hypothetical protein
MKINLLREDQMTKVPHQGKDKEVLRFDDTFSGGNDDFYFQQPTPPAEEYKKPRKFRFWLFLLILIIVALGTAFIVRPDQTIGFFKNFGHDVTRVWNRTIDKIQTSWLHRNDNRVEYVVQPTEPEAKPETEQADLVIEEDVPQQVIKIEKPIEKEVVKETTEEKVLESPEIFDRIRDELAISRRNMIASEFVWSKVPGGMIMDEFAVTGDDMTMSVRSRFPLLIQSYSKVIEQHDMFTSVVAGEQEEAGEMTRVQLSSSLPALRKEDRPERIWDLDVEWFDDYLVLAANNADVVVSSTIEGTEELENNIVKHMIKVKANGNRVSMMGFLQELQAIPAAFVVNEIVSTYDDTDQSNLLEMELVYYERE